MLSTKYLNNNILRKTVPQYLSDRGKDQNETYLRFLDLVGQSHDCLLYTS